MPFPGGLWWLFCCRQGFTLLRRDYGGGEAKGRGRRAEDEDDEEEEEEEEGDEATFEVRSSSSKGGQVGFARWRQDGGGGGGPGGGAERGGWIAPAGPRNLWPLLSLSPGGPLLPSVCVGSP